MENLLIEVFNSLKEHPYLLVLVALCVLTGSLYAQKSVKLGHFNSGELMKRMPEADSIQTVLKNYATELDTELKSMQDEYTRLLQEYEAKKDQLTDLLKKNKEIRF